MGRPSDDRRRLIDPLADDPDEDEPLPLPERFESLEPDGELSRRDADSRADSETGLEGGAFTSREGMSTIPATDDLPDPPLFPDDDFELDPDFDPLEERLTEDEPDDDFDEDFVDVDVGDRDDGIPVRAPGDVFGCPGTGAGRVRVGTISASPARRRAVGAIRFVAARYSMSR